MINYKIYIIRDNSEYIGGKVSLLELVASSIPECGFDSIQDATKWLERYGDNGINYTILPYIYMKFK